jgi:hypothetical protein
MVHKKGCKLGKYNKRQKLEFIHGIEIESGVEPPPMNMTSPWSYLAWNMKANESVLLKSYDHVMKLKHSILKLGFKTIRRKIGEDQWRIWKVHKKYNKSPSGNPIQYSKRTLDVISSGIRSVRG